jgi:L-lactate permease
MKEIFKSFLILILGLAIGYFLISFVFSAVIIALKVVVGLVVLAVIAFTIWTFIPKRSDEQKMSDQISK